MRRTPAGFAGLLLLSVWALNARAMDGFAVTTVSGVGNHLGDWFVVTTAGPMVKYAIAGDRVTRCDTIYRQHWADYPILNVQGTKVAFIRKDLRGGADTSATNDVHNYVCVLDLASGIARDLDTLNARFGTANPPGGNAVPHRLLLAWPAGDYIYYHDNTPFWYEPNGTPTGNIWKVKYDDPSTQQLVYVYRDVQTFSMSLDGSRASITSKEGCAGKSTPFCNIPHAFPPTSDPDAGSWAQGLVIGCGSYISPSGKHHWHFWEGGHTMNRIETINLPNQVTATAEVNFSTIAGWITAATGLAADSITGGNMEWGRWAVNSDKWLCGIGNNKIGALNQILWNWIDNKAINTSRNSVRISGRAPRSNPGALWVAGGPCGSYEDVNGNWVATSVSAGCSGTWAARPTAQISRGISSSSHDINVYTVQGRLLGIWNRSELSRAAPAGAFFIAAVQAAETNRGSRCVIIAK